MQLSIVQITYHESFALTIQVERASPHLASLIDQGIGIIPNELIFRASSQIPCKFFTYHAS
jgi:hypothetical protein